MHELLPALLPFFFSLFLFHLVFFFFRKFFHIYRGYDGKWAVFNAICMSNILFYFRVSLVSTYLYAKRLGISEKWLEKREFLTSNGVLAGCYFNASFFFSYFPCDPPYITSELRQSGSFKSALKNLRTELESLQNDLGNSVPFFSSRYKVTSH